MYCSLTWCVVSYFYRGSKKGNANPSTMSKLGTKLKGVFTTHVGRYLCCPSF